ncbi:hypothetical protein FPRO04_13895 [Fusarium proliferatum]|nr:hypothetical protein FPRO04_13895 [Fusarium proliferatum]
MTLYPEDKVDGGVLENPGIPLIFRIPTRYKPEKNSHLNNLAKPLPRPPILRADSAPPQCSGTASNSWSVLGGQVTATSNVGFLPIAIRPKIGSRTSTMGSDTPAQQTHLPGTQVANNSTGTISRAARSSPDMAQGRSTAVRGLSQGSYTQLSGLMCEVYRTTGRGPPALVGATTTILGDKLYVFGGRTVSGSTLGPLTSDLHELDLIRRHWTKLEATGDIPLPRYFHSMCALGGTKMVCYGGMSLASNQSAGANQQQPETIVMSDVYIYDVHTRKPRMDLYSAPEERLWSLQEYDRTFSSSIDGQN